MLSNLLPALTSEMCNAMLEGNYKRALEIQMETLPLANALFCEVNPIPVKSAMARMGFCDEFVRLPLTVMENENKEKLFAEMKKFGL